MPYIRINGIKLFYIDKGKGKTLLFLHSWMADHSVYDHQIKELSKKYRVIAIDIRGHGRSTKTRFYRPYIFSKDLYVFIKKLKLRNITLIGSSLGGDVAAHYLISYGYGIDSLVLVNTSAKYLSDKGYDVGHSKKLVRTIFWHLAVYGYKRLIRRAIRNLFSENADFEDIRRVYKVGYKVPMILAIRTGVGMIFFDIRKKLHKIKVPTLVIYGIEDKLCNYYSAKYWTQHIPSSSLVVFDNSGHYPFIEEKEKFNDEIRKFVKS